MSKFSKNILEKIKKEKIKPRPRWQFILLHILLLALFVISIFLGSIVTGMIIREIQTTTWGFVPHLPGMTPISLLIIPMIWLITLGLVTFTAFEIFKKTKKGYKYRPGAVMGISIVASIVLGLVVYNTDVPDELECAMANNLPPYAGLREQVESVWDADDGPFMLGEIVTLGDDGVTVLSNRDGEQWTLNLPEELFEGLEAGREIIVMGIRNDGQIFEVEDLQMRGLAVPPCMHAGKQKSERK